MGTIVSETMEGGRGAGGGRPPSGVISLFSEMNQGQGERVRKGWEGGGLRGKEKV